MLEQRDDFLARLEHDLPSIEWAEADSIRHRGQAHRRRRRAVELTGALVAALALVLVGTTITRSDHAAPVPIQQHKDVPLSPDLCRQSWLVAAMHVQHQPCATTATPGTYLDANHGLNRIDPFVVTLPTGWSFDSLAPHGLGSQVDLSTYDGAVGIRIATYVGSASAKPVLMLSRVHLLNLLRAVPGLTVSPESRVRIGGEPAVQVDITSGPSLPPATADCEIQVPCLALFRQVPLGGFGPPPNTVGAVPGTTSRLIFPPAHSGAAFPPTLIWIWDTYPSSDFRAALQRAQPILDSLDFSPPRLPGN